MIIGFDTGFFVELLRGNLEVLKVWKELIEQETEAIVSCLSLFELERLGLKGAIEKADVLVESISQVCKIMWLTPNNLSMAAKLSHGLGIPSIDSLILSGLLSGDAKIIYTTDSHIERYKKKGMTIKNIRS